MGRSAVRAVVLDCAAQTERCLPARRGQGCRDLPASLWSRMCHPGPLSQRSNTLVEPAVNEPGVGVSVRESVVVVWVGQRAFCAPRASMQQPTEMSARTSCECVIKSIEAKKKRVGLCAYLHERARQAPWLTQPTSAVRSNRTTWTSGQANFQNCAQLTVLHLIRALLATRKPTWPAT
jgi:hypothetical protein